MSQQGVAAEKGKTKSLAGKIMKWITIPVIIIFLASGILILKAVQTTVTDLSKKELNVTSQSASYQINEFFTMYRSRVIEASTNKLYEHILTDTTVNERLQDSSYFESAINGLEKSAVTDDNILSCWLADFDASAVIMSDGYISEPGWDVTQRPWYKVNETKKTVITEPYEDANTGKQVVTLVAPVFDESGNMIGASGVDIATEKLAVIMKEYNKKAFNLCLATILEPLFTIRMKLS